VVKESKHNGGQETQQKLKTQQKLEKLNVELPHDPASPAPGIYPTEEKANTCPPTPATFIVASFTIAKRWKPERLSMDEWIDKMGSLHTGSISQP